MGKTKKITVILLHKLCKLKQAVVPLESIRKNKLMLRVLYLVPKKY